MTSLATTLKRFNRKERYWVVRTALGAACGKLDPSFCAALEEALADREVRIDPDKAWWATDYHFNWLFAALHMYCEGHDADAAAAWDNGAGAVQGNQEDIDLVVAQGDDLVLIEAKNGSWSRKQLRSKLQRLELLNANDAGIVGEGERRVRLHLVLMSPRAPSPGKLEALLDKSPAWMRNGGEAGWRWMRLRIDEPAPDCKVHLSDARGRKSKAGSHWTVAVSRKAV